MNPLGTAIMVAMRDQGWLVLAEPRLGLVAAISPITGETTVLPDALLNDSDDSRLRYVLMALVVAHGLMWPWPPDHREEVHGEQPMTE